MVYINMDIVKSIYFLLLFIWSAFLLVLIITLIRETFPKTENVKKAVEEFVPGPNCVSLDVSKLEDDHGLKAFTDYDVVKDTAQFINY
ncbi:hypothetical protein L5515_017674 [Caenorhabditis briggsae]|uniref:Uncharacterized protein n=1 Tax=Caenorhabditis briggsae TaxID=6238 RepID=A0AAE9JRW1_CAEBR|nr:hypothetical protein L3Y34_011806 [Caenorhabditis briggsae]UMM41388.1 hypothetical protein L5515_017674 [Caenorhabditis briggsae]